MALTELQRVICRLLADNRIASGESYVAGGVALNLQLAADRISRDIDLFHDSEAALEATWRADRRLLEESGFEVTVLRERPGLVEAEVALRGDRVRMEWARDSAFRFFPLVEHDELGLTLHPFDLATNKVLALVGRLEARDWVDVLECDQGLQPLGYLTWAACGKDPGFGPTSILEHAARTARYSAEEVAQLSFAGPAPDVGFLSRRWREMLAAAREIHDLLPPEEVGKCVLTAAGNLSRSSPEELRGALERRELRYHAGRLRGALPQPR
jgi:hypothetical protein